MDFLKTIAAGLPDALRTGIDTAAMPGDGATAVFAGLSNALDKRDMRSQQAQQMALQELYRRAQAQRYQAQTANDARRTDETIRHNRQTENLGSRNAATSERRAETDERRATIAEQAEQRQRGQAYADHVTKQTQAGRVPYSMNEWSERLKSGGSLLGVPMARDQMSAAERADLEGKEARNEATKLLSDKYRKDLESHDDRLDLLKRQVAATESRNRAYEQSVRNARTASERGAARNALQENRLRGELSKYTVPYEELKVKLDYMDNVLSDLNSGRITANAADQAIVIGFNKLNDPGSVVRESEFARTPEFQSLMNTVEGYMSKVTEGGVGLAPEERASLIETARLMKNVAEANYAQKVNWYKTQADLYGLREEAIINPFAEDPTSPPSLPNPELPMGYTMDQINAAASQSNMGPEQYLDRLRREQPNLFATGR